MWNNVGMARNEAGLKEAIEKINKLLSIKGKKSVDAYHKELGLIMWDNVGMARNEAGLKEAIEKIQALKAEFWKNVYVAGDNDQFNQELEKALRLVDFFEIGELMARDALNRNESCGGHFREEMQTEDGEIHPRKCIHWLRLSPIGIPISPRIRLWFPGEHR